MVRHRPAERAPDSRRSAKTVFRQYIAGQCSIELIEINIAVRSVASQPRCWASLGTSIDDFEINRTGDGRR